MVTPASEPISNLLVLLEEEINTFIGEKVSLQNEVRALQTRLASVQQNEPVPKNDQPVVTKAAANDLDFGTSDNTSAGRTSHLSNEVEKRRATIVECYRRQNVFRPGAVWTSRSRTATWGHPPERRSFQGMVSHPLFDMAVGVLIIINTFCMAGEMQYQGRVTGYDLGFRDYESAPPEAWKRASDAFEILDKVFIILFTLELGLRFLAFRLHMFRDPMNWIDIVAVGAGFLYWILEMETAVDNMLLRLIRIAKLVARSLRLLKLTKFVESLHILVKSISASISTLVWSLVLLLLFQFVAGMMISQLVSHIILDENVDLAERTEIFSYYGTFLRSQITMFEIHLANFGPPCRILVNYCGEMYGVIFLAYRCLAGFAVLNVINAVFIQQTITLASKDSEILFMNRHREVLHHARDLKRLFNELDGNGDGEINFKEWRIVKANPKFVHIMNALEINAADTTSLFELLDLNGDGVITIEEFVEAALCLKGNARSVDVLAVLGHLQKLRQDISAMQELQATLKPAFARARTSRRPTACSIGLDPSDPDDPDCPITRNPTSATEAESIVCATETGATMRGEPSETTLYMSHRPVSSVSEATEESRKASVMTAACRSSVETRRTACRSSVETRRTACRRSTESSTSTSNRTSRVGTEATRAAFYI